MAKAEKDYLLDHSYDGIEEYDNPLPSWWVNLFLASIVFSFFYFVFYVFGPGTGIHDAYDLEAAAFFEMQAKQFEGIEVTEALIYQQSMNADLVKGMKKRFQSKCSTCHGQEGEGDACPNLTDMVAKNGGDLMSIYKTIKDGVKGTEMKSWVSELGPAGVLNMAAFVGSLRGKNLPSKRKPEGNKFEIKIPDLSVLDKPAEKPADTPAATPVEKPAEKPAK